MKDQIGLKDLSDFYKIGNGYFSDVYTWNKDCSYVLKMYNSNIHNNHVVQHLPDYEILMALQHVSNIPKLIAYSDDCCVMTRVPGFTLDQCSPALIVKHRDKIISELKAFATEARKAGYLINDLNLGNITLTSDGNVGIIDFNAYIEEEYRFDAFNGLNMSTALFNKHGVDILGDEAIDIYMTSTINDFDTVLTNRIG